MTDTSAPRGFTGWHMLAAMLLFFGVVIGVNVYLSVMAIRTWTGVVVDNSYKAGLDFNEKVKRAEEQLALGWTSHLRYAAGTLHFELHDVKGAMLKVSGVTARITRPIGDRDDQAITLTAQPDGSFLGALTLASGIWNVVTIAADTPHGAYERRDQITVP
ncbi:MAG: FixH family protein [Devosia nanyangense]|uniref:FixH family protein n=1 Tax=Devosia nanyangense TaxID=1228055 RepID=A0A933NZM4_9HYPH|nr:FixH family protein [Devosia nanyangense]